MNDAHAHGAPSGTCISLKRHLLFLLTLALMFLLPSGAAYAVSQKSAKPPATASLAKPPATKATAKTATKNTAKKVSVKTKGKKPYIRSVMSSKDRAALKERGISSGFGPRAVSRRTTRMHKGIDIPGPKNSKIVAYNDGEVTFVGRKNGYGVVVIVKQIDGRDALYAHMNKAVVKRGDAVTRGTHIGLVGRTGRATGYHLHFEIIDDGEHLDPALHVWHGSELVLGPNDLDPANEAGQTRVASPSINLPGQTDY